MKSISFYIVTSLIKLKGIKSSFSKAPIDYLRLRKNDIKAYTINLKINSIPDVNFALPDAVLPECFSLINSLKLQIFISRISNNCKNLPRPFKNKNSLMNLLQFFFLNSL